MNGLDLIKEKYIKYEKVFKTENLETNNKIVISTDKDINSNYDESVKIGSIDINFNTEDFNNLGNLHPKERLAIIGAIIVNEINNYINK